MQHLSCAAWVSDQRLRPCGREWLTPWRHAAGNGERSAATARAAMVGRSTEPQPWAQWWLGWAARVGGSALAIGSRCCTCGTSSAGTRRSSRSSLRSCKAEPEKCCSETAERRKRKQTNRRQSRATYTCHTACSVHLSRRRCCARAAAGGPTAHGSIRRGSADSPSLLALPFRAALVGDQCGTKHCEDNSASAARARNVSALGARARGCVDELLGHFLVRRIRWVEAAGALHAATRCDPHQRKSTNARAKERPRVDSAANQARRASSAGRACQCSSIAQVAGACGSSLQLQHEAHPHAPHNIPVRFCSADGT